MSKRGMSMQNMNFSNFYCTSCGKRGLDIPRRVGKERPSGHLKKMFCLYCGREVNFCEIKPNTNYQFNEFKMEYEYGNFTEEGTRKLTYKELRREIKNGNIEKIKTLDAHRDPHFG